MSGAIPSWARAGAEVVCVADFSRSVTYYDRGYREMPVFGQRYRLTGVDAFPDHNAVVCRLEGFPSMHWFDLNGFKPAVSQADDLAIHFQALLNVSNPEQVEA